MHSIMKFLVNKIVLVPLFLGVMIIDSSAHNYQEMVYGWYANHLKSKVEKAKKLSGAACIYVHTSACNGFKVVTPYADRALLYSKNTIYPVVKDGVVFGVSSAHKKIRMAGARVCSGGFNGVKSVGTLLYEHKKRLVATGVTLGIIGQLVPPMVLAIKKIDITKISLEDFKALVKQQWEYCSAYAEKLNAEWWHGVPAEAFREVPLCIKDLPVNKDMAIQQWHTRNKLMYCISMVKQWCQNNLYEYQKNLFNQHMIVYYLEKALQKDGTDKEFLPLVIQAQKEEMNRLKQEIKHNTNISAYCSGIKAVDSYFKTRGLEIESLGIDSIDEARENKIFKNTVIKMPDLVGDLMPAITSSVADILVAPIRNTYDVKDAIEKVKRIGSVLFNKEYLNKENTIEYWAGDVFLVDYIYEMLK